MRKNQREKNHCLSLGGGARDDVALSLHNYYLSEINRISHGIYIQNRYKSIVQDDSSYID